MFDARLWSSIDVGFLIPFRNFSSAKKIMRRNYCNDSLPRLARNFRMPYSQEFLWTQRLINDTVLVICSLDDLIKDTSRTGNIFPWNNWYFWEWNSREPRKTHNQKYAKNFVFSIALASSLRTQLRFSVFEIHWNISNRRRRGGRCSLN